MKAVTVEPGVEGSLELSDVPTPEPGTGQDLLVEGIAVGICGTDREIIAGKYGTAPPGDAHLIIGHESLGRVLEAPSQSGFQAGDPVVGIVRRPDPAPCSCCASGRGDMCLNGNYTERGIKGIHGYASEAYLLDPRFAIRVGVDLGPRGVLVEPASVVSKAWRKVYELAAHNCLEPRSALITGAGPIGLLAALVAQQKGLDVHVLDRASSGPKPALVAALGATYHRGPVSDIDVDADVSVECTGAPSVIFDLISRSGPNRIVCLTGVSAPGAELTIDAGEINRQIVLNNAIVFGSVNASREDYESATAWLAAADEAWLDGLMTRRVPLGRWREAYESRPDDVKTVLELT